MKTSLAALFAIALASPALAEVRSSGPNGFVVETVTVVPVPPSQAYDALSRIGLWWSPAHTYSGNAANLSLDPRAGGCFCEAMPEEGGSIEHLRVVMARPGKMLRLSGGLGPLQGEGVAGALTWSLKPVEGGTEITQTYVVGGNISGGAEAFAVPVDSVLSEQLSRLTAFLSR